MAKTRMPIRDLQPSSAASKTIRTDGSGIPQYVDENLQIVSSLPSAATGIQGVVYLQTSDGLFYTTNGTVWTLKGGTFLSRPKLSIAASPTSGTTVAFTPSSGVNIDTNLPIEFIRNGNEMTEGATEDYTKSVTTDTVTITVIDAFTTNDTRVKLRCWTVS